MGAPRFKLVIIESPYAGDTKKNILYLRSCMRDCLLRFEAPFASHALYAQSGVLDDLNPAERRLGMEAGFAWSDVANLMVVYIDRGISSGMREGIQKSYNPVVYRSLLTGKEYASLTDLVLAEVERCRKKSKELWA